METSFKIEFWSSLPMEEKLSNFQQALPMISLKFILKSRLSKPVKGAAMMAGFAKDQAGFIKLELKYTLDSNSGGTFTDSWNYIGFSAVHSTEMHPKFDLIFCNGNRGKKVTYSLSTNFDVFKTEEEPMMYSCLKLPELIYYRKELSDIKLICESKIFEYHKLVLSCRSNVFQAMFNSNSSKFQLRYFLLSPLSISPCKLNKKYVF